MILRALGIYHPFFAPLKRRVLTVLALAIWAGAEWYFGNDGWALGLGGLAVVCAIGFFINYVPDQEDDNA